MAGEKIEIVIDANGLARTEQVFKTLDKYMDRIQRRVDKLGRLKVSPMVRLVDRVTPQLEKINRALNRMQGQIRKVTIVPVLGKGTLRQLSMKLKLSMRLFLGVCCGGKKDEGKRDGPYIDWGEQLRDFILKLLDELKKWAAETIVGWIKKLFGVKEKKPIIAKILRSKCAPLCPGKNKSKRTKRRRQPNKSAKTNKGTKPNKRQSRVNSEGRSPRNRSSRAGGGKAVAGPKPPKFKIRWPKIKLPKIPKLPIPKLPKIKWTSVKGLGGKALGGMKSLLGNKGAMKSIGKIAGKSFRPLAVISDAMSIFGAKPGKERNKAIRSAVGGWGGAAAGAAAGAAIGSVVPILGTAVGGLIGGALGGLGGSAIGENIGKIGKKIGGVGKKIGGFFGWGGKKKKEDPVALPTPAAPNPVIAAPASASAVKSLDINVSLPAGAVQLTVSDKDLNYDEISAIIGNKVTASIRQAMENRT